MAKRFQRLTNSGVKRLTQRMIVVCASDSSLGHHLDQLAEAGLVAKVRLRRGRVRHGSAVIPPPVRRCTPVVDNQGAAYAAFLFLTSHLQQNFAALLGMDDRSTDFLESVFRRGGN